MTHKCTRCGTVLKEGPGFPGLNIMSTEHWFCDNASCGASFLYQKKEDLLGELTSDYIEKAKEQMLLYVEKFAEAKRYFELMADTIFKLYGVQIGTRDWILVGDEKGMSRMEDLVSKEKIKVSHRVSSKYPWEVSFDLFGEHFVSVEAEFPERHRDIYKEKDTSSEEVFGDTED